MQRWGGGDPLVWGMKFSSTEGTKTPLLGSGESQSHTPHSPHTGVDPGANHQAPTALHHTTPLHSWQPHSSSHGSGMNI